MKFCMHGLFALIVVAASGLPAKAAVLITGEVQDFSGPGTYVAEIFAQAIDQSETIGGFNISIDASSPNITYSSVTFNSIFDNNRLLRRQVPILCYYKLATVAFPD